MNINSHSRGGREGRRGEEIRRREKRKERGQGKGEGEREGGREGEGRVRREKEEGRAVRKWKYIHFRSGGRKEEGQEQCHDLMTSYLCTSQPNRIQPTYPTTG